MIICLTGMHRSGTSLFSSYLQHCGINMGESMAAAGHGNKHGHFEDRDFLELHKTILKRHKKHMYKDPGELDILPEELDFAKQVVLNNCDKFSDWGWKDPRTSLFLDLWNEAAPETKFVFLYRNPYVVIDSLFRRRGERFLYFKPLLAADAWLLYNKKVLEFVKKHPEKSVVLSIDGINVHYDEAIPKLSDWLDYSLEKPYTDIYHKKDISTKPSWIGRIYMPLIKWWRGDELDSVYKELESIALVKS